MLYPYGVGMGRPGRFQEEEQLLLREANRQSEGGGPGPSRVARYEGPKGPKNQLTAWESQEMHAVSTPTSQHHSCCKEKQQL